MTPVMFPLSDGVSQSHFWNESILLETIQSDGNFVMSLDVSLRLGVQ